MVGTRLSYRVRAPWALGAAFAMLATVLATADARADEPANTASAERARLIRAGRSAAAAKQWDACIESYKAAIEIEDAPKLTGDLGLCEEQARLFPDAHRHLRNAIDAGPTQPKTEPWIGYHAAFVRVQERVAIVYVTVTPTNAAVVLDGRPMGRADGRGVAVTPGTHQLAARLAGYEDKIQPVTVSAGDVPHVHLDLTPKSKAESSTSQPAGTERPKAGSETASASKSARVEPEPLSWYMPAPTPRGVLVPLAAGTAVLAVANGVAAGILDNERATLRSQVEETDCALSNASPPAVCQSLRDRYTQQKVAIGVSVGAAITTGALAAATGVLIAKGRDQSTPTIVPTVSSNGGGILLIGTW